MGRLKKDLRSQISDIKKPKIVFFGNERLATGVSTKAPTLQALIKAGYDVKAVVSNYERGTSRSARELEIKQVADSHNIPVLLPDSPIDIIDQLKNFDAKIAVLVAYGRIIPQSIIDIFPYGIVNIHPSLLPLHRGPIPIESVILSGEERTGVSIMQLVKAMDAGPVYGQKEIVLNNTETKQELADMLLSIGSEMVIGLLPGILDGSFTVTAQDDARATYDKMIKKEDGKIDWSKPAVQLERGIRAFVEWPKSSTILAGKEVIITKAHVCEQNQESRIKNQESIVWKTENGELAVQTSKEILIIDILKPASKKEMTAREFLAGYGKDL
jgi:methionyl-tRNA formyltransferase